MSLFPCFSLMSECSSSFLTSSLLFWIFLSVRGSFLSVKKTHIWKDFKTKIKKAATVSFKCYTCYFKKSEGSKNSLHLVLKLVLITWKIRLTRSLAKHFSKKGKFNLKILPPLNKKMFAMLAFFLCGFLY